MYGVCMASFNPPAVFAFLVYFGTPSGARKKFLSRPRLSESLTKEPARRHKNAVFGPFVTFFVPDLPLIGPFRATPGPGCACPNMWPIGN